MGTYGGKGVQAWRRNPVLTTLCVLTVVSTAFICVAGTYVTIKAIITQYNEGSRFLESL